MSSLAPPKSELVILAEQIAIKSKMKVPAGKPVYFIIIRISRHISDNILGLDSFSALRFASHVIPGQLRLSWVNLESKISKTVQEKLDDGQPRDYLSEIRQCTILFINLVFDLKVTLISYPYRF